MSDMGIRILCFKYGTTHAKVDNCLDSSQE